MKKKSVLKNFKKKAFISITTLLLSGILPMGVAMAQGELAAELNAQQDGAISGKPGEKIIVPVYVSINPKGTEETNEVTVDVYFEGNPSKSLYFAANEFNVKKRLELEYIIPDTATTTVIPKVIMDSSANKDGNAHVRNNDADYVEIQVNQPQVDEDTTDPIVTAIPDRAPDSNGWYNQDVTVTFDATDEEGGSGLASVDGPKTVATEGKNQVITGYATDKAGNEGSASITVNIDKTAPVIEAKDDVVYTLNQQNAKLSWSATDNLSGLEKSEGTIDIDTTTVGPHTATIKVKDIAGNEAVQTINYKVEYSFKGFFQPINMDGSSVFKINSAIPVKFQLTDGNGAFVSNAIATISYRKISNDVLGDKFEDAVSKGKANDGNNFRYDFEDNQYIFNFETKGLTAGTYLLKATLNDGTSYNVQVSLR